MQALYFRDMQTEEMTTDKFVELFCAHYNENLAEDVEPFFFELINGVLESRMFLMVRSKKILATGKFPVCPVLTGM